MSRPTKLFETYKLGPITLANRFAMAPLTRNRAAPGTFVPSPLAVSCSLRQAGSARNRPLLDGGLYRRSKNTARLGGAEGRWLPPALRLRHTFVI